MLAAVDLDELTQPRPARAWLINLRRSLPARNPESCVRHELPERFLRQPDSVAFQQLLAGQRGPDIGVPVTDDRQRSSSQLLVQPTITGTVSLARDQSSRARLAVTLDKALNLPYRHAQPFGRTTRLQTRVHHSLNHLQAVEFSHVQCHECCSVQGRLHSPMRNRQAYRGRNATFLSSQNTTFL